MCAAISYAAKSSISAGSENILSHSCTRTAARSVVTIAAALKRSESILPVLSIQEMPRIYQDIHDIVKRKSQSNSLAVNDACRKPQFDPLVLEDAYKRCRNICEEHSKTFYLGTLLLTKERQRAIWAIYVWCRRTDDLVDDPSAVNMSSAVLDAWEDRLEDIFSGRPHDMLDAALVDTIFKFPLDIKPFKDMIKGMRMDMNKNRYANFEELSLYCYHVAGTVGLMSLPVLGIAAESPFPAEKIYNTPLYMGIGSQLTNILRDVGEDASRGRVYLPQDELAQFGLSDEDVFSRKVSNRWREFMKEQIKRTKIYYDLAEEEASQYDKASRWTIWSVLMMYRMILDEIEQNDYDNLTKRADVGRIKKLLTLPLAYLRALSVPSLADW